MTDSLLERFREFLFKDEPWREYAACRNMGPRFFFPDRGESQRPGESVCAICPVVQECGVYGDESGSTEGIWGGSLRTRDYRPFNEETKAVANDSKDVERDSSPGIRGLPSDVPSAIHTESSWYEWCSCGVRVRMSRDDGSLGRVPA